MSFRCRASLFPCFVLFFIYMLKIQPPFRELVCCAGLSFGPTEMTETAEG